MESIYRQLPRETVRNGNLISLAGGREIYSLAAGAPLAQPPWSGIWGLVKQDRPSNCLTRYFVIYYINRAFARKTAALAVEVAPRINRPHNPAS